MEPFYVGLGGEPQNREIFYIGQASEEQRKEDFMRYFGVGNKGYKDGEPVKKEGEIPIHLARGTVEDPYIDDSWYTRAELTEFQKYNAAVGDNMKPLFARRYRVTKTVGLRTDSATQPDLYNILSTDDYFRHVLYDRSDLFMKAVPLIRNARACNPQAQDSSKWFCGYMKDEDLDEIYNEIKIAYFLNELRYGYSNVLSLHFMTVVDWFAALRQSVNATVAEEPFFYQMIVSERLDKSMHQVLEELANDPYATDAEKSNVVRAILFQVFHAMETAWHTNNMTHNDLHTGNVMLQKIPPLSPLYNKDFLYRRLGDPRWYRVPAAHTRNYLVKIIDFGRNRLYVPSKPAHVGTGGAHRHLHDRLICAAGFDNFGYGCDVVNRHIDVRLVLGPLSSQVAPQEVRDMVRRLIDPDDQPYQYVADGATVSDALGDAFFESYHTARIVPEEALSQEQIVNARDSHAVVSFLVNPREADMQETEGGAGFRSSSVATQQQTAAKVCPVCLHKVGETGALQLVEGGGETLCGRACYEFKYLFQNKTVFR